VVEADKPVREAVKLPVPLPELTQVFEVVGLVVVA
jgi:hypothetical protein